MAQSDSDRKLYEYQRQLKAPKVMQDKFPSITAALDPYAIEKTDQENYNSLGDKTPIKDSNGVDWLRNSESKATRALVNDIYKPPGVAEFLDQLKGEHNLSFNHFGEEDKEKKLYGAYMPTTDELVVNTAYPVDDQLDTAMHEVGHARDYKQYPNIMQMTNATGRTEGVLPNSIDKYRDAIDNKDLFNLSDIYSGGHFVEPRSHSINELLRKMKSGMAEQGIDPSPDSNPRFDELNQIKSTVKDLEGYKPPQKDSSAFDKLKALFSK